MCRGNLVNCRNGLCPSDCACILHFFIIYHVSSIQDVFINPDSMPKALAELEHRKFTAEEGVRSSQIPIFDIF